MAAAAIGTSRAAYSAALICQRCLLVPRHSAGVSSTLAKTAQLTRHTTLRHTSKTSVPNFCAAHPEDRLKAARRKARADLGLPDGGDGKDTTDRSTAAARDVPVSAKAHPEDRLKAARRKMLESMGLAVDSDGNVVESRASAPTLTSVGNSNCNDTDESAPLPICAQNNHPDYRLKVARERMLAKVKGDAGVATDITAAGGSSLLLKPPRIDLEMSPDRRLRLARTEQAAKPIQTFKPMKRKRRRLKKGALLSRLTCSTEQPPLLRNDGYSSGSVTAMRLRQARHDAIERLLVSSSPADASLLSSSASSKEKDNTGSYSS